MQLSGFDDDMIDEYRIQGTIQYCYYYDKQLLFFSCVVVVVFIETNAFSFLLPFFLLLVEHGGFHFF